MKKALITGANRSIGLETARQLLQQGYYVYLGAREGAKGDSAVQELKAEGHGNVETIVVDVADAASIRAAREALGQKTDTLDVLVNNAGILGGWEQGALELSTDVIREVYETNFFGVIEMTQAFIDLLRKAPEPRIVNVTSGLGSLTLHSDPSWKYYTVKPTAYWTSKAALNAYTITLAYELRDTPFKVSAVDPGYTATDFNNHSGPGSVQEAAARVVKAATLGADGPTGQFYSDDNISDTGISPW
ncbi:MAG: SDR family oxidoreductase [Chitinophagaceae bacterium]|nr:MAG: SDR family oxidoreductase [Chitinophagaceae bacterium]